jgi:hypothetical protein
MKTRASFVTVHPVSTPTSDPNGCSVESAG